MRIEFRGALGKDRVVKDYTLLDFLSLPQPRTCQPEQALKQLIEGHEHKLDFSREETPEERKAKIDKAMGMCTKVDDVESIDWWCDNISDEGREFRLSNQVHMLRRSSRTHTHTTPM